MKLAAYLDLRNMSPAKLAEKIGVPASTITRILNGDRAPRLDTIQKITAATDGAVTADDFLRPLPAAQAGAA
jgi:transcriptional regulator with XRE-family HTH domain